MTIIDDSSDFVSLVREVLEDRYDVTAVHPRSMEDVARTRPDVLMVDLHPHDDRKLRGWQIIEGARAHASLRDVPIIICTGATLRDGDVERSAIFPALHILSKPFSLDSLDSMLATALDGRAAAAS
jgi:CheY-like chemotaxis protein